jgi:hypothetical protein
MEFRWENRVAETKTKSTGEQKTVMRPIPIVDMIVILIMRFAGFCLKRTKTWGVVDVTFN